MLGPRGEWAEGGRRSELKGLGVLGISTGGESERI